MAPPNESETETTFGSEGPQYAYLAYTRSQSGFDDVHIAETQEDARLYIEQDHTRESNGDLSRNETDLDNDKYDFLRAYLRTNSAHRIFIPDIFGSVIGDPSDRYAKFVRDWLDASEEIEELPGGKVYRCHLHILEAFVEKLDEIGLRTRALFTLPDALLMSFVSSFDAFVSDFLRHVILDSTAPLAYSERTLTLAEVLSTPNLEALKRDLIDREVERVLRESHAEQATYMKKACGFNPLDGYSRRIDYLEVFERRNLAAHGVTTFSDTYCRRLQEIGDKQPRARLGKPLNIPAIYLTRSLDIFAEFACLLVFYYKAKRDAGHVDDHVVDAVNRCVDFIKEGRLSLARWILEFLRSFQKPGIKEYTRKIISINLALVAKKDGAGDEMKKILLETDWTASAEEFRIGVASLHDDVEEVARLMITFKDESRITREDFREWPVFDHIRDKEPFQEAFKQTFGEPIWASVETDLAAVASEP